MFLRTLCAGLLLGCVAAAHSKTLFVDPVSGDDAWSGLCETFAGGGCGPKRSIAAAIASAPGSPGNPLVNIELAPGTYTGPDNRGITILASNFPNGLVIAGPGDPNLVVIDCEGSDRAFEVPTGFLGRITFENFTVQNGVAFPFANQPTAPFGGGAMRLNFPNAAVRNCRFINNTTVASGSTTTRGGAIECLQQFADAPPPVFEDCVFEGNVAEGAQGIGGAVFVSGSSARLINCVFIGNTAGKRGGAAAFSGGSPKISRCVLRDNEAQGGGAIEMLGSNGAVIQNSIFEGNRASAFGGALLCGGVGFYRIENCLIAGNVAGNQGGGCLVSAILGSLTMSNVTLANNRAQAGGAIFQEGSGTTIVERSIVWGNEANFGPAGHVTVGAALVVRTSQVMAGESAFDVSADSTISYATDNYPDDPLFVSAGSLNDPGTPGDVTDDTWTPGDYRLQRFSPAIDSADEALLPPDTDDVDGDGDVLEPLPLDVRGAPRVVNTPQLVEPGLGRLDRGAYEHQPDCNGNGVLDAADIAQGVLFDDDGDGWPDACQPEISMTSQSACNADTLVVDLQLDVSPEPLLGAQLTLRFDPNRLAFRDAIAGAHADPNSAFDLLLGSVADPSTGDLDYAVGITPPTSGAGAGLLGRLTFDVLSDDCDGVDLVTVRSGEPGLRATVAGGYGLLPRAAPLPATPLDRTPPVLVAPLDVSVVEGDSIDPNATGIATASDNCALVSLTFSDIAEGNEIQRTWRAEDACGNASEALQTITIEPPPALLSFITQACDDGSIEVDIAIGRAPTEVLGGQFALQFDPNRLQLIEVLPGGFVSGDPNNPFDLEIFELSDGGTGSVDYAVGVVAGAAGSTDCPVMARLRFTPLTTACDPVELIRFRRSFPGTRLSGEAGESVPIELLPADDYRIDLTAPTLNVPADVVVFELDPTDPNATGFATAVDNCDGPVATTFVDTVTPSLIEREWRAEDACGNVAMGVQHISISPCDVGDVDCNGSIDALDALTMLPCLNGPDNTDPGSCAVGVFLRSDIDADGDVDVKDLALLQRS